MPGPADATPGPGDVTGGSCKSPRMGFFRRTNAPAHLTAGSGVERKWQMTKLE